MYQPSVHDELHELGASGELCRGESCSGWILTDYDYAVCCGVCNPTKRRHNPYSENESIPEAEEYYAEQRQQARRAKNYAAMYVVETPKLGLAWCAVFITSVKADAIHRAKLMASKGWKTQFRTLRTEQEIVVAEHQRDLFERQ